MNDKHHIFSQLKETLHSHQEDYVTGAWEEFVKKRKWRRAIILFWRLSGAAAVLLLLIGLFWLKVSSPVKNEQSQVALQHPIRSLMQPSTGDHSALHGGNVSTQKNQPTQQNTVSPTLAIVNRPATTTTNKTTGNNAIVTALPDKKDNQKDNYNTDNKQQATDTSASRPALVNTEEKKTEVKKFARITKPIYDSLMGHHTTDPVKKEKKNLSYAAIVSPALGSQKLNFGAGFEIAYPITGNLSVSSGIAYSSLYAENNVDNNSGSLARQLQGANLDVSGFEVPLGLTYKTKSGFYATAGVLAMTVIADHLEYNYLVQRTVAMLNATPSGASYQTMSLVSSRQTEPSQEKINNYLGFYQFSAGQKAIIGKKEFNIGPFVKLPFGSVSNENIKLMQAGIRLGIGF
jgi:hypothetical protein